MVSGLHFRRFIRDSWDTCTVRRMGTKCGPDFVEWGPVEDLTTCTFKSYLNREKLFFTSRGFINAEVEWHHCTVSFQIDYLLESMRKVLLFRFHSFVDILIGPRYTWGPICGSQVSLTESLYLCLYLTDVTLADEDTNTILIDDTNRAIQGNVAMQATQPGGKICN